MKLVSIGYFAEKFVKKFIYFILYKYIKSILKKSPELIINIKIRGSFWSNTLFVSSTNLYTRSFFYNVFIYNVSYHINYIKGNSTKAEVWDQKHILIGKKSYNQLMIKIKN